MRAARALLHWSQDELAERAGVSRRTVSYLEDGRTPALETSLLPIRRAFEANGLLFIRQDAKIGILYDEEN